MTHTITVRDVMLLVALVLSALSLVSICGMMLSELVYRIMYLWSHGSFNLWQYEKDHVAKYSKMDNNG